MKIAFISDTHDQSLDIENCDLIAHCGDAWHSGKNHNTALIGAQRIFNQFKQWREIAPVIYVPGNHDFLAENMSMWLREEFDAIGIKMLIHELHEINGLRIFGTPFQPYFCNWAFNMRREVLALKHKNIPDCDILLSHAPCHGIMDKAEPHSILEAVDAQGYAHPGCDIMLGEVQRIKPKIFAAGHLHQNYGTEVHGETTFVACSVCDESYKITRPPIYISL